MKNLINYYYSIKVNKIIFKDNKYYFNFDDINYCFLQCNNYDKINLIYYLNKCLIKFVNTYEIILNKYNNILTDLNNKKYVLIKLVNVSSFCINDVIKFNLPLYNSSVKSWKNLWQEKVDYLEYQMSQYGKKYFMLRENFNYYIGLAENAIEIVNQYEADKNFAISHVRLNNLFDLHNPLNLTIDLRIRDISEYFKGCFFKNININKELEFFLCNNNLSSSEQIYFLARMMFPTYFFDLVEEVLYKNQKEEEIKKIVLLADKYEIILHKIYHTFKNNLIIEWLE